MAGRSTAAADHGRSSRWLDATRQQHDNSTQQFNVDGSHRRYIMSAMGRSWRNYKSILTRKIRALVKSNDVTRKLEALKGLKPRNIKSERQWQRFIKERIFVEFKLKSKRFQKMRSKQTNIHRTSRKGMARLRHEMVRKIHIIKFIYY
ncbi:hypothetical protein WN944_029713 [Citrus x changshan-huyou]|uniref:Uncharacterized protein n=1 Tax=Citrus x changshan-huyou TaxID=2935761 RepID=A0AAP0LG80_9ROSI